MWHRLASIRFWIRLLLVGFSLGTTLVAGYIFATILGNHSIGLLKMPMLLLFVLLMLWISLSFWTATLGFVACLFFPRRQLTPITEAESSSPLLAADEHLPRTAIVMPIYNEEPASAFSGARATLDSLQETGHGQRFDFFILSDTTQPEIWLEEELAWARLREAFKGETGIYYRHRARNSGRKSGNIADFCERWGSSYKYMVVLDADSIMSGDSLLGMVRRMEADPKLGMLQTPVAPVNRSSLLARTQQFAASVYGDIFTRGFALWTQTDGNYFGHNAIIRLEPFVEHCGLPKLPGQAPLGGEILSHDFVEAALMRRAGWKVVIAHDLAGSYEACPTTLNDFVKRDQRWCQGNLQHLRLVFAGGLHPASRVHLGMGVMSYLSSPLWLLLMLLSVGAGMELAQGGGSGQGAAGFHPGGHLALGLFLYTMALLLLPKFWGYLLLLREPERLKLQGGALRALLSVLLETAISVLLAPLLMVYHVTFVFSTLLGHNIEWTAQRRGEAGTPVREAVYAHATHTLIGVAALLAIASFAPSLLLWTSPVLAGLIVSIPLAMILGSSRVGRWLGRRGILLIPEESEMPMVLQRQRGYLAAARQEARRGPNISGLIRVVVDPAFHALHLAILRASGTNLSDASPNRKERIRQIALHGGPTYLTREHKLILLADEPSLRWLHRSVWSHWPLAVLKAAHSSA